MTDSSPDSPASQASPASSNTAALTPPAPGNTPAEAFAALVDLMRLLREPNGCPWDREQTLETLKPFVLEEAHEVVDAIERGDMRELCGEVGDLIFEGVFLARIAEDLGAFTIADALRHVHAKLVRRHPHVFGDASGTQTAGIDTPAAVKGQWEQVKAAERADAGKAPRGLFDGIPKTLPALLASYDIGQRAAATGFDWPEATQVLDKIAEETDELREALATLDRAHQEEELGDLLFAVANLARKVGIEPEAALRAANRKFTRRFAAMQARLEADGHALGASSLEEMEAAWQAIKHTK
jgi:MazG family protein